MMWAMGEMVMDSEEGCGWWTGHVAEREMMWLVTDFEALASAYTWSQSKSPGILNICVR